MKLQTTYNVENNLTGMETNTFSIAANAKAFRLLLDGLYTNKIRAVIRELWTNAYDSHLEAGIGGVPFDCHLPSRLDPTFKVRDYGVSMDHDTVMKLYTTVFDSTKDATDDLVGALGLGSKSPFAYTDQFQVTAWLNGTKRTYLAAMDTTGTPTITAVGEVPSDLAQGVEVSFAVKPDDFHEFSREARQIAAGFDPLPEIDGIEIEAVEPVYVADDNKFAIFPPHALPGEGRLSIRQGCVMYPVSDYDLTHPIDGLIQYSHKMVIDVPIGTVAVVASREALSLDDETRQNVKRVVAEAAQQLKDEVAAQAAHCTNRLEAMHFWYGGGHNISSAIQISPTWQGKPLGRNIEITGGKSYDQIVGRTGKQRSEEKLRYFPYQNRKHFKFVTMYDDKPVVRQIKRYVAEVERNVATCTFMLRNPTTRQLERLYTLLGLTKDQIVWAGSLPDPGPPVRLAGGKRGLSGVNEVVGHRRYKKLEEFPTGDYLWFEVERTTYDSFQWWINVRDHLKHVGFPDLPVLTMTAGAVKRYKPKAKNELRALVKAFLKQERDKLVDILAQSEYADQAGYAGMASYLPDTQKPDRNDVWAANKLLSYDDQQEAEKAAQKKLADAKEKYPLLFDRLDNDAIQWYIDARDAERKVNP